MRDELGDVPAGSAGGRRCVLGAAGLRPRVDARRLRLRLGHRAGPGLGDRHAAHDAPRLGRPPWQRLGRALPQHPAAGADVPLVLRRAGVHAGAEGVGDRRGSCARAVRLGGALPRALHLGADRRAGPRRHPVAAARPAARRARAGADAAAGLPLRAAADGVPDHHPAAHQRDDEPDQELVDRAHHRAGRAHLPRPRDRRVHVQLLRGVLGRDADLRRDRDDGEPRDGRRRAPDRGARLHRQGAK